MERFHLRIWGENNGLTPTGGGQPSLPSRHSSISNVLSRHLHGRIHWALRALKKFDALVFDLGSHIKKLNQLLAESQKAKAQKDKERVSIVLVDSVTNQPMLELLLAAVKAAPTNCQTRVRVKSKAMSTDLAWSSPAIGYIFSLRPTLSSFTSPEAYSDMKRFVTMKKMGSEAMYVFERKDFDRNISHDDKEKLVERIQRLVMLFSKPKKPVFRTLVAEGCIHDPSQSCWCMVFQLPALPSPASTASRFPPPREPVSLLSSSPGEGEVLAASRTKTCAGQRTLRYPIRALFQ
ncbi:hypothetical protein S40288_09318 [Stachybotrys chartarum IBT 40288]|nr:hypothetical protein S40288_09318 [Stachybotrys chartarum IBT 40288]